MKRWIMNARMYAVTPAVEAHWIRLLEAVTRAAGIELEYLPYPAPLPLEALWQRGDLGCVFMCGYPIACHLADVVPIAAPVPSTSWSQGRAVYRSDLIVRADRAYSNLTDTFGGRAGWTVRHSHSGFNAFRHHLLRYRTPERASLYGHVEGDLITARAMLEAVREGRIDVGPLDGYWHLLMARHAPEILAGIRVLASTDVAPIPAFVASRAVPASIVEALRQAFVAVARDPQFDAVRAELLIEQFVAVDIGDFAPTLAWHREAIDAGYDTPA
jgi:ABC-type phosphate/phosphonate transport system substrate-binding protein